ncbi:CmcJ/NvfI family oxidoreductase [Bradyrhizobium sp. 15]|uniref:CmcJ/NvfI family oxidoreductase n=1 Tax=Bradyrhizobium sp. 15 TaxID=2782633 RepID=UPI001FF8EAEC|nr:CmcJ/NvfI family oxidoreductase [Bradyrhizobium sp. 15]
MGNAVQASSKAQLDRDQLQCVQGRIGFARRTPNEDAPAADTPDGFELPMVSYDVTIRNARPVVNDLSLDREGFTVVKHKSSSLNERDPEIMAQNYLDEMVPFIKDHFNASWVNTVDVGGVAIRSLEDNAAPRAWGGKSQRTVKNFSAGNAHIDYSPVACPRVAARDAQLQGIEIRPYSRLMIIQAWRTFSEPPQDFPLAFCDASSIVPGDLIEAYQNKYGAKIQTWFLHHNPAQRWYYLPDMTADEFFLFKGYDSNAHYDPRSAHSAFDNRRALPNAKPRKSIEARFYVYYD